MKAIETPLTVILLILCLGFTINTYYDNAKLNKEKCELAERESKTIEFEVPHDGDPKTNTTVVTVPSTIKECTRENDKITYLWKQTDGDDVELIGEKTSEMSFEAEAGKYEFTLTLTDPYGPGGSENVIVLIGEEPNEPPIPIIHYGEEESTIADESPEEEIEDEDSFEDLTEDEIFEEFLEMINNHGEEIEE